MGTENEWEELSLLDGSFTYGPSDARSFLVNVTVGFNLMTCHCLGKTRLVVNNSTFYHADEIFLRSQLYGKNPIGSRSSIYVCILP